MLEMREQKKLKFSNAIPGWAKVFQKVVLYFFYLVASVAFVSGVVLLFWQQWSVQPATYTEERAAFTMGLKFLLAQK